MEFISSLFIHLLYFVIFGAAIFLSFFVPGDVLLKKFHLSFFHRVCLSTILGLALWIWQGFVLGFLNLRLGTYIYLLVFFAIWVYTNKKNSFSVKPFKFLSHNKLYSILIILGVFVQASAVIFTGIQNTQGLYFCCGNISDSIYHISLANQLVENVPPLEPGMYDVLVRNYHYLSNLVSAELSRVYLLPLSLVQFQFLSVFISVFLGLTAISFAKNNNFTKMNICWLLFFLYFSGDAIYLLLIILGKGLSFSMGSLEDSSIFLVNPPRAFAMVMFFGILSLISIWVRKKSLLLGVLIALMCSTVIGLKVYVGVFIFVGLSFLTVYYILKKRFDVIILYAVSLAGALTFYLPVNAQAGGMYYVGFWVFENFISQPKFELIHLELARNVYKDHKNHLRVAQYELMYMCLYMFSIFGTKLLAIFQTKKSLSLLPLPIHIFLFSGIVISFIIGIFFQQEAGGSNTFNFIATIFIVLSIYASIAVAYWLRIFPFKIAVVIGFSIILATIPRVVYQVYQNIEWVRTGQGFLVENSRLETIDYLKNKVSENSLVLIDPSFLEIDSTTPLASVLTNKRMYLSGEGILDSHMIDTKQRASVKKRIIKSDNPEVVAKDFQRSGIDYIVTSNTIEFNATESAEFLDVVFSNNLSRIYRVSSGDLEQFIDRIDRDSL